MTPLAARAIADKALGYIAADTGLTGALLAASGAGPEALRAMAEAPEFAVFVLEFLLDDDDRVLGFATAEGLRPDSVLSARAALEGPGEAWSDETWTDWP